MEGPCPLLRLERTPPGCQQTSHTQVLCRLISSIVEEHTLKLEEVEGTRARCY